MDGLGLRTFDVASFVLPLLILHQHEQNHRQYSSTHINSLVTLPRPTKYTRPVLRSLTISWTTPPQHYCGYPHSPMATYSGLGAPIPFTPYSRAVTFASDLSTGPREWHEARYPPYGPSPSIGLPYLYPFGCIRRVQSYSDSYRGTVDLYFEVQCRALTSVV